MPDEFLAVGVQGVRDGLFRVEGLEALALHFADHLDGVVGDGAEGSHDRAVFHGPGGADAGDEVGEGGDGQAEVGFRRGFSFGREVDVFEADDGEARAKPVAQTMVSWMGVRGGGFGEGLAEGDGADVLLCALCRRRR